MERSHNISRMSRREGSDRARVRRVAAPDVSAVVATHREAFPGFFLTALGPRFLTEYYRAAGALALVATDAEDRVIGFVVGSTDPGGFYRRLFRARWWAFALAALPAVLREPRPLRRVLGGRSHDREHVSRSHAVGLFSLGVSPGAQGLGVGRTLVAAFVEQARSMGGREILLTTDADDNQLVLRFYGGLGFTTRRAFTTPAGRHMLELHLDVARALADNLLARTSS
jgi:ribosomal protein S18 acetylase RimI-like enzyme